MKPRKARTIRIRPFEGDEKIAKMIAERTGLAVIDVMSLALQAGLKAIAENNYRFELPIELRVVPSAERQDALKASAPPDNPSESIAFSSETTPPYRTTGRNRPKS
jgi:hypothetical protein